MPERRDIDSAAKKYDRSKVEEGDRRIVEGMLKHTRPVESAATALRDGLWLLATMLTVIGVALALIEVFYG